MHHAYADMHIRVKQDMRPRIALPRLATYALGMGNELSRNFARVREKLGLKQEEFADELGVSQGSLSRYISGSQQPGINVVRRLAELAGASIEDLIDRPLDEASEMSASLSVDDLTTLMRAVQAELPANLSFGDWPSAAAAALHARLALLSRGRARRSAPALATVTHLGDGARPD